MPMTTNDLIFLSHKLIEEALEKENEKYKCLKKNKKSIIENAIELCDITNRVIGLQKLLEIYVVLDEL